MGKISVLGGFFGAIHPRAAKPYTHDCLVRLHICHSIENLQECVLLPSLKRFMLLIEDSVCSTKWGYFYSKEMAFVTLADCLSE